MPRYRYYDVTPDGESNEFNCTIRAITVASGLPYRVVEELLIQNAKEHSCDRMSRTCYAHLLEDVLGYEYIDCGYKYTVQEIADMYSDCIVIIRIDGHLSCSALGCVTDIFDCTQSWVDCIWLVKR